MEEEYREDWDGAWKHVLEHHLEALLEFSFPDLYQQIDWSVPKELLNTELVLPRKGCGRRRHVDFLVRLAIKGSEQKIVLHMEVQGRKVRGFPLRLFDYSKYLTDEYGNCVLTILILADSDPHWRPNHYVREHFGQKTSFSVPCLKILDHKEEDLLRSPHPAAFLLLASLKALATRRGKNHFAKRLQHKQQLAMRLLSGIYSEEEANKLFRSLDWLLALPADNELQFREWHSNLSNQSPTPTMKLYTLESLARKEGLEQGIEKGLERGLEQGMEQGLERGRLVGQVALLQRQLNKTFGILPDWVKERLETASEFELEIWAERILSAPSLEELFQ